MKDFPLLKESSFVKTRKQFHLIAHLIGKVRETLVSPIAKNDNLWLSVVDSGFCTPPITEYNDLEIGCNPEKLIVEIANNKNQYDSIEINNKTLPNLKNELVSILRKYGVETNIDISSIEHSQTGVWERGGISLEQNDTSDFLTQLYNYHLLLKEFYSRIREGVKTQICLWPHHFDNAFKWFSGKKINDEDEQMGIGVSNGDDSYSLPYIYMTLWPPVRRTNKLEITESALFHDSGWTGMVLPYESVAEKKTIDEQRKLIEEFFNVTFESIKREFSKR